MNGKQRTLLLNLASALEDVAQAYDSSSNNPFADDTFRLIVDSLGMPRSIDEIAMDIRVAVDTFE
jgi:hypothetical protein